MSVAPRQVGETTDDLWYPVVGQERSRLPALPVLNAAAPVWADRRPCVPQAKDESACRRRPACVRTRLRAAPHPGQQGHRRGSQRRQVTGIVAPFAPGGGPSCAVRTGQACPCVCRATDPSRTSTSPSWEAQPARSQGSARNRRIVLRPYRAKPCTPLRRIPQLPFAPSSSGEPREIQRARQRRKRRLSRRTRSEARMTATSSAHAKPAA